ncbi:MAG TPA: hypothetical protein VJP02_07725 [Candidatus Sulfotelmatobacter sp.]|nr:hypothetical protein [Candidatus Sulfotelmatobacter sp.]
MSLYQGRAFICFSLVIGSVTAVAQGPGASQSSSSSSSKHTKGSSARLVADVDAGTVADGGYRNRALGLSCKIPAGWVLRTEEMNARDTEGVTDSDNNPHFSQNQGEEGHPSEEKSSPQKAQRSTEEDRGGRVLLAAFSRPPDAKGEDVNASIVIAMEKVATYPGLKEAAQYFGPLTEVAKARGFAVDEEPYEIEMGTKVVVREDFHKDVGARVMRQSTVAFLARGYAVSITVIGGTEDEVEELLDGVTFGK